MCVFALKDCKTPEGVLISILMENSHDASVSLQLSGGCELTVVLHDFSAGCSTELSVCTGEGKRILFLMKTLTSKLMPERYTALSHRPDGRTVGTAE